MHNKNCWEEKKCGREPGGVNANELGVCQAAVEGGTDGLNNGKNGGRVCWALAGTLCGGKVQGTYAAKLISCMQCDFFKLVKKEQGRDMVNTKEVLEKLAKMNQNISDLY